MRQDPLRHRQTSGILELRHPVPIILRKGGDRFGEKCRQFSVDNWLMEKIKEFHYHLEFKVCTMSNEKTHLADFETFAIYLYLQLQNHLNFSKWWIFFNNLLFSGKTASLQISADFVTGFEKKII